MMIAQYWDLHVVFIRWHQSEAEGHTPASFGKREKSISSTLCLDVM